MQPRVLSLLLLIFVWASAGAQEAVSPEKPPGLDQIYLYHGFGAEMSRTKGFAFSMAGVVSWPSGWGGALRLRVTDFPSVNEPLDYTPGFCFFGKCKPRDGIVSLIPAARRLFKSGNPLFAFAVEGGPAVVFSSQRIFTPNTQGGWFGPSYIVTEKKETGFGASARAGVQLRLHPNVGGEIGFSGVINPYHNNLSLDFAIVAGLLRRKTKL